MQLILFRGHFWKFFSFEMLHGKKTDAKPRKQQQDLQINDFQKINFDDKIIVET